MNILELNGLTRRFGALTAVDGVNLSIQQGEIFGLLGPNGAGKTTVIKMLTTLLPPSAGTAWVAGFDIQRQAARVRAENLRLFAKLYGVPRREIGGRVNDALKFVGLEESGHRVVRGYSGGMVRRLEIALALIHRPRVLFLDEPTVGLDPLARQAVWKHVRQLAADFGMTILLTTHLMEEADSLCDRVAVMNRGQVTAIGSPAELKATLGRPNATLDDVFARYSSAPLQNDGDFREISRTRRGIARLG